MEKQKPYSRISRSFKNFNLEFFNRDASTIDWNYVYTLPDVDSKIEWLNESILFLFNTHAPLQTVKISNRKQPWFTEILDLIRKLKCKAWLRYKNTRNLTHKKYFCAIERQGP